MTNVFNVQVFFVVFRESLEAVLVVSVLLAFLKQGLGGPDQDQAIYKKLRLQVWVGSILGVFICLCIGCAFIAVFYTLGHDIWGKSEEIWEGTFCMIATILITIMGIAMLRINKMKEKWRTKIAQALVKEPAVSKDRFRLGRLTTKYCMFVLPFITCLREGLEAVVFVGGVGLSDHTGAAAFPLPVICGLIAGVTVGVLLYYFGSTASLQVCLIVSTCILYLISAGLFSRGTGGDASESGSGPGSYDISKSVWHVNCCNPELDNGWDVFNALLGWQNSATYGSVISYNVYWIFMIVVLGLMMFEEKRGHLPFCKNLTLRELNPMYHIKGKKKNELSKKEQEELFEKVKKHDFGVREADRESSSDVSKTGKDDSVHKVEEKTVETSSQ
ncbi:uncharacterized protein CXQ87_000795 [Candidozyma duobushaemuli]|uniref:Plasma membrane iron permease n=1 Tax=Candidozyma duobushaemuli TaxID=1231522 RepID=A0A2V1AJS5_9ASCO|nr:uncharacterized protein CXQ87_000795 [[Candida] duobushaemulonis]PVH17894.1 hypothetical protein CXQ87_000795 [[Candida] duobushaemulonis]